MWRRHNLAAAQEIIVDAAAASSDLEQRLWRLISVDNMFPHWISLARLQLNITVRPSSPWGSHMKLMKEPSLAPEGSLDLQLPGSTSWKEIWLVCLNVTDRGFVQSPSKPGFLFPKAFYGFSTRWNQEIYLNDLINAPSGDDDELQIQTLLIPRRTTVHSSAGLCTVHPIIGICNQEEDNYEVTLHTSATKT